MATSVATPSENTTMTSAPSDPSSKRERLPVTVTKPSPYTFSLSHLTALDPNPLPPSSQLRSTPALLHDLARDGAQSLINQILLTCAITTSPSGVQISLPNTSTPLTALPRLKRLPTPKPPTKWEQFARKKGIGKFGAGGGSAKEEERRKKMVYDEERGEWVPKWGYKGSNKEGESDWLVELDEKMARTEGGLEGGKTIRGEGKRERMEKMRRQERRMRANEKKSGKGRA